MVNKVRGTFTSAAIKAPGFGDRRKGNMLDLAVLTGGQLISPELGYKLENVTLADLGRARRIVITKNDTTIIDGLGAPEDIKARMAQLRGEHEASSSDWDKEKLMERIAKLTGGVALIKVGAATEVELQEKKHRIEDAVSATKAAIEEGVVAGGGTALLRARDAVNKLTLEGDELTGARIVWKALEAPVWWIATNAGEEGSIVVRQVEHETGSVGFNAATLEFEDLFKAGVIDPAKVTRSALQNAASVAAMVLTTEVLVSDDPRARGRTTCPAARWSSGMGGGGMLGM